MGVKIQFVPHPEAPLYQHEDPQAVFNEAIAQITSGNTTSTEDVRQIIRQTGLVNLWYYGKFICGYSGPYDLLNTNLHMDMCNYRQGLLKPGGRGFIAIPRGHYKTTVVTELGTSWETRRDPDLRVRITGAISDKAQDFMKSVKATYDSNEMAAWLYPESTPATSQARWNDTELVLPNRGKTYREATVEYGGVGGASEGHHYDLHIIDDMIGLGMLNSSRQSNAGMLNTKNWFWASEKTLLVSMRRSRVIVVGTRYAVDDVYDDIIRRGRVFKGYPLRTYKPVAGGQWEIYYRKAIEDGKIIFPEEFTQEAYDEMARDDWWTFVTQYLNDPQEAGLAEFNQYDVGVADMEMNQGEWWLSIPKLARDAEPAHSGIKWAS